jgi:hypothetical protein
MNKKCIDCQQAGNNEEGIFICYCLKSNLWMKEVLNKIFDCPYFENIEIGGIYEIKK